ncbi:MAG: MFS transporter [Clostridia bacterium]|nr:MFS transporter [Clostridia bacterium]
MNTQIRPKAKKIAWMLAFIYFSSYTMRINFAVMLVKVCTEMQAAKTELAVVITALTVAYGVGQVISGLMGDKINPAYLLSAGLGLAIVCNGLMFFCGNIPAMTVVWCVNGFAHALLWPPIVRLMSTYLSDAEYSYSAVRVSWGSSAATIVLYLVCPLLLYVMDWRAVMLLCAAEGAVALILWLFVHPRLLDEPLVQVKPTVPSETKPTAVALPKYVYFPIVLIMLGIVLQGILRDGVTNWMPSYLLETFGLSEENSIISTVILAVFSVISFAAFDLLHRKVFHNEVFCAAVIFAGAALSALVLYLINLVSASVLVSMLLMAVIVSAMHGINLMLITVVPKRFVRSGKVSTYSGILNACTYVGAALSSYGFAALAEQFGWNFTILTWVIVAAAGLAVCLLAASHWKKFKREYAECE